MRTVTALQNRDCHVLHRCPDHERAFECGLAHVHRSALTLAVVIRVVAIAPLRPTACEWTAAGFAAHETTQRKSRVIPLLRPSDNHAAVKHGLRTEEHR